MELTVNKGLSQKGLLLLAIVALVIVASIEPAHAQAWANKANTAAEQIVTGLKLLGRTVAIIVGIWGAVEIFSGRKRFSDMMSWFVGAAVFISVTEMVNLFFS